MPEHFHDIQEVDEHGWSGTQNVKMGLKDCRICQKLIQMREENYPVKRVESISKWWWGSMHDDRCLEDSVVPGFLRD